MKKTIAILIVFFINLTMFAQNIDYSFMYSGWNDEFIEKYKKKISPENIVYLDENYFFKAWFDTENMKDMVITIDQVYKIKKTMNEHFIKDALAENRYFLEGKGLVIQKFGEKKSQIMDKKQQLDIYNSWLKKKSNEFYNQYKDSEPEAWLGYIALYNTGIKNIYASSVLIENTKIGKTAYVPDNLLSKIYYEYADEPYYIRYDSLTPPWVEGKEDYGIGEYLDIEFKWPSDELQILNGFVDFTRMDLYEKNSRVKTVLIESENPKFSKEYEIEDLVRYTLITLPQKTDKIRMTIKDVYPGSKYKDTCLSSILVTNPNVPSYEEMSTKILNAMKEGVYDRRYDKSEPLPDFIKVIEEEKPKKSNKIKKILGR